MLRRRNVRMVVSLRLKFLGRTLINGIATSLSGYPYERTAPCLFVRLARLLVRDVMVIVGNTSTSSKAQPRPKGCPVCLNHTTTLCESGIHSHVCLK